MANLSTYYPAPITAADLGLGVGSNATFGSIQNTPIGSTTASSGSFTTLTANNGTLTGASAPVLDLAQTWNNAAVTFRGVNWSFVDTSSGGSSEVLRISTGAAGASAILNIRKDGNATFANGVNVGTIGGTSVIAGQGGQWRVSETGAFVFCSGAGGAYGTGDVFLRRDAANTLAQYNGANAQAYNIYNTFTSSTNYERGFLRWSSNNFEIGSEAAGSGSNREVRILAGTATYRFATNNLAVFPGSLTLGQTSGLFWFGRGRMQANADGVFSIEVNAGGNFDRLQFGGTTASFPALKRSSTVLQARLADDSGFAPLQGQLRTHANAVTETITADKTLTLYDAAGTAYKVPCVAA